jgi:hypothetical protein
MSWEREREAFVLTNAERAMLIELLRKVARGRSP